MQGACTPELRPRTFFFSDVLGIPEDSFSSNPTCIESSLILSDDGFHTICAQDGTEYAAGRMRLMTIGDLRAQTKNFAAPAQPGRISLLASTHGFPRGVDQGSLQADPKNNNAVFLVASNFNGLELIDQYDRMLSISDYVGDHTQGPYASISAAPGLILRHYYWFKTFPHYPESPYNPDDPLTWRQTPQHQLNLLDKTTIPVRNGYAALYAAPGNTITEQMASFAYTYEDIQVLVHEGIEVPFGYKPTKQQHEYIPCNRNRITQVFSAAIGWPYGNSSYLSHPRAQTLGKDLIKAAFEGTIRAALLTGASRVYLIHIGGGVFGNPHSWLVEALASLKPLIISSGIEVVVQGKYNTAQANALLDALISETDGRHYIV